MSILVSKYKSLALTEIENDYSSLSKRKVYNQKNEYDNFLRDTEIAIAQLNFAHRIQLIGDALYQDYVDKFQNILQENINTSKERLFRMREQEKKNLNNWKKEVENAKDKNANYQSQTDSTPYENDDRQLGKDR